MICDWTSGAVALMPAAWCTCVHAVDQQGEWKPRQIPNPAYYQETEALQRLDSIGAVAIEIWTTDKGYRFSNVLLSRTDEEAAAFRAGAFRRKHDQQVCVALVAAFLALNGRCASV